MLFSGEKKLVCRFYIYNIKFIIKLKYIKYMILKINIYFYNLTSHN